MDVELKKIIISFLQAIQILSLIQFLPIVTQSIIPTISYSFNKQHNQTNGINTFYTSGALFSLIFSIKPPKLELERKHTNFNDFSIINSLQHLW